MSDNSDARVFLLLMAARMVGNYLYYWGGEEADEGGFDCSGFASVALMQAARAWPDLYGGGRTTARGLYAHFDQRGCPDITDVDDLKPGCLLFYRRPGQNIHHVAIHAANVPSLKLDQGNFETGPIAFESGGSGSAATTPRAALMASAGVRLTASDRHGSGVEWVAKDPFVLLGT
ncbi:MAG: NlpC/P60 family protein [Thermoanaerobaculia bacterium]